MTWIKICGTTNLEDALTAVDAGADALGFVFYEKSPRKIDPETARQIVAELPDGVERIGVFVEEAVESVRQIVEHVGLTGVQIYQMNRALGLSDHQVSEQSTICSRPKVILVIPGESLADPGIYIGPDFTKIVQVLLIDSISAAQLGGTGQRFDWGKARHTIEWLGSILPIIVAGGLTPANVTEAIRILKPWGVDVASGVEARPGKKDPDKVRDFIAAVRQTEKSI
jgi:phosphoribosylanthranilate isomerase